MLNRYEMELGDADKFDKAKLRDELERIRLYVKCTNFAKRILKLKTLLNLISKA